MFEICSEHQNKIERICLDNDCTSRALCLLCQHDHSAKFQSIMIKKSESYKHFENVINQAIDQYFFELKNSDQQKIKLQQFETINKYFDEISKTMQDFLNQCRSQAMKKLQSDEQIQFGMIKKARINRNYVNVPQDIFQILQKVYEGTNFSEVFKNRETSKSEESYTYLQELHKKISDMMSVKNFKLKIKLPDIRKIFLQDLDKPHISLNDGYSQIQQRVKFDYNVILKFKSETQFGSIITDSIKAGQNLMVTSYDKILRILDRSGQLLTSFQYQNVLTKIESIGEDVYAIAKSKEILIDKIAPISQKIEQREWNRQNIMTLRGHSNKINDIHFLNTRIIGSSSLEGVKIWDLYKEKCQYTLKDQAGPLTIKFLPKIKQLVVGLNNHLLKIYSVETMKLLKNYNFNGVPLTIQQGNLNQQTFLVGGFTSNICLVDLRLSKFVFCQDLKSDAPTCITQSLYDQTNIIIGDRSGSAILFDLRTNRVRFSWLAHDTKTNLSKPKGIVKIFEQNNDQYLTVGCNQRNVKLWQIEKLGK